MSDGSMAMMSRRALGIAVLVCVLAAQTLGTVHSLTAVHKRCAEHGIVTDESLPSDLGDNDRTTGPAFEAAGADSHDGSRDHCAYIAVSSSKSQQQLRASLSHLPPPQPVRGTATPDILFAAFPDLLLLAPKHSPPLA
jgi:hypothetical protein